MQPDEVLSALGWQEDAWSLLTEKTDRDVTTSFYRYQNDARTVTVTFSFATPLPYLKELSKDGSGLAAITVLCTDENAGEELREWLDAQAEPEEDTFGDSDKPKVTWKLGGSASSHPNWERYAEAYTQARGGMMKPDGEAPLCTVVLQREEKEGKVVERFDFSGDLSQQLNRIK